MNKYNKGDELIFINGPYRTIRCSFMKYLNDDKYDTIKVMFENGHDYWVTNNSDLDFYIRYKRDRLLKELLNDE